MADKKPGKKTINQHKQLAMNMKPNTGGKYPKGRKTPA